MADGTIILVPGFGGSMLTTPPSFFGYGPPIGVWLNPPALAAGGWRLLGLAADGVTPDVPLTGRLSAGYPLPYYYSVFQNWFAARGWRVVSPVGDWRLELDIDRDALLNTVYAEAANAPLHLIGHSRGGLVMRAALESLRRNGDLGLIGRCAGLGVPHQGSWVAQGVVAGWAGAVVALEAILTAHLYMSVPGAILGEITGVTRTWPGAYGLLPKPGAPGLSSGQSRVLYDADQWAAINVNASQRWLDAAQLSWASLPEAPASVEWVDVAGLGFDTPTTWPSLSIPRYGSQLWWGTAGDNTVPFLWAIQTGRKTITTPTSHGSMVLDGRVFEALDSYLRNGLAQSISIGGALLQ